MAMEIAAILTDVGLDVLGPVASVSHALALIESGACDAAVLDTNLGEETSEPIARRLSLGGTPFVIVSGYAREQQPAAMGDAPLLVKPLQPELLVAAIKRCLSPAPVI